MSPAQDIARFLHDAGHGVIGTSIFVGLEPPLPNTCITVYDTGGGDADTDEVDIFTPSFQVRVRHPSYEAGHDLATDIRRTLLSLLKRTTNGRVYFGFAITADVAALMRDERERHVFVASYSTTYQEAP